MPGMEHHSRKSDRHKKGLTKVTTSDFNRET